MELSHQFLSTEFYLTRKGEMRFLSFNSSWREKSSECPVKVLNRTINSVKSDLLSSLEWHYIKRLHCGIYSLDTAQMIINIWYSCNDISNVKFKSYRYMFTKTKFTEVRIQWDTWQENRVMLKTNSKLNFLYR